MAKTPSLPRDAQTLMYEIGRAITVWQHLENTLGEIFCILLGEAENLSGPARAAYCSVLNLGIRLDMVHAAMHAKIDDAATLLNWDGLYGRLGRLAKHRNKLVHFSMVDDQRTRTKGFYLVPSPVSAVEFHRARLGTGTRWDATQLASFTEAFGHLHGDLADLLFRLRSD